VKTSWLKWKPDWDNAADKYMKAGMYWHFVLACIYYSSGREVKLTNRLEWVIPENIHTLIWAA